MKSPASPAPKVLCKSPMYSFTPSPLYAPSSSPASSPEVYPIDSSPFSSPSLDPLALDDREVPVIHPYAASYFSSRQKRVNPGADSEDDQSRVFKKARYVPKFASQSSLNSEENAIWTDASDKAYEEGTRTFKLEGKNLKMINTSFITDLQNMVVLPQLETRKLGESTKEVAQNRSFDRVPTAPAIAAEKIRSTFSRIESTQNSTLIPGERNTNIFLYLGNNQITGIPRELFVLSNLVVLSLRNNGIRYLPPEIALLVNLKDFNISVNKLSYLPCELNKLPSLSLLKVHPNPFMEQPDSDPAKSGLKSVTQTEYRFGTHGPSLVEMTLRILISPPSAPISKRHDVEGQPPRATLLDYYLPFSLETLRGISPAVAQILNECMPGCMPFDKLPEKVTEDESTRVTGTGICPSPMHGHAPRYFARHAEERLSWETRICGLAVGGAVPVRWRGCSRGCLSFLDQQEVDDKDKCTIVEFEPVALASGSDLAFDDDD